MHTNTRADPFLVEFIVNLRWLLHYAHERLDPCTDAAYPQLLSEAREMAAVLVSTSYASLASLGAVPIGALEMAKAMYHYLLVAEAVLGETPATLHVFLRRAMESAGGLSASSTPRNSTGGGGGGGGGAAQPQSRKGASRVSATDMSWGSTIDTHTVCTASEADFARAERASADQREAAVLLLRWLLRADVVPAAELVLTLGLGLDDGSEPDAPDDDKNRHRHSPHTGWQSLASSFDDGSGGGGSASSRGLHSGRGPQRVSFRRAARRLSQLTPFYLGAHLLLSRCLLMRYTCTLLSVSSIAAHVESLETRGDGSVDALPASATATLEDCLLTWLRCIVRRVAAGEGLHLSQLADSRSCGLRDSLRSNPRASRLNRRSGGPADDRHHREGPLGSREWRAWVARLLLREDLYTAAQDGAALGLACHYYVPHMLPVARLRPVAPPEAAGVAGDTSGELRAPAPVAASIRNWAAVLLCAEALGLVPSVTAEEMARHGAGALQLHVLRFTQELFAVLATTAEEGARESVDLEMEEAFLVHTGAATDATQLPNVSSAEVLETTETSSAEAVSPRPTERPLVAPAGRGSKGAEQAPHVLPAQATASPPALKGSTGTPIVAQRRLPVTVSGREDNPPPTVTADTAVQRPSHPLSTATPVRAPISAGSDSTASSRGSHQRYTEAQPTRATSPPTRSLAASRTSAASAHPPLFTSTPTASHSLAALRPTAADSRAGSVQRSIETRPSPHAGDQALVDSGDLSPSYSTSSSVTGHSTHSLAATPTRPLVGSASVSQRPPSEGGEGAGEQPDVTTALPVSAPSSVADASTQSSPRGPEVVEEGEQERESGESGGAAAAVAQLAGRSASPDERSVGPSDGVLREEESQLLVLLALLREQEVHAGELPSRRSGSLRSSSVSIPVDVDPETGEPLHFIARVEPAAMSTASEGAFPIRVAPPQPAAAVGGTQAVSLPIAMESSDDELAGPLEGAQTSPSVTVVGSLSTSSASDEVSLAAAAPAGSHASVGPVHSGSVLPPFSEPSPSPTAGSPSWRESYMEGGEERLEPAMRSEQAAFSSAQRLPITSARSPPSVRLMTNPHSTRSNTSGGPSPSRDLAASHRDTGARPDPYLSYSAATPPARSSSGSPRTPESHIPRSSVARHTPSLLSVEGSPLPSVGGDSTGAGLRSNRTLRDDDSLWASRLSHREEGGGRALSGDDVLRGLLSELAASTPPAELTEADVRVLLGTVAHQQRLIQQLRQQAHRQAVGRGHGGGGSPLSRSGVAYGGPTISSDDRRGAAFDGGAHGSDTRESSVRRTRDTLEDSHRRRPPQLLTSPPAGADGPDARRVDRGQPYTASMIDRLCDAYGRGHSSADASIDDRVARSVNTTIDGRMSVTSQLRGSLAQLAEPDVTPVSSVDYARVGHSRSR